MTRLRFPSTEGKRKSEGTKSKLQATEADGREPRPSPPRGSKAPRLRISRSPEEEISRRSRSDGFPLFFLRGAFLSPFFLFLKFFFSVFFSRSKLFFGLLIRRARNDLSLLLRPSADSTSQLALFSYEKERSILCGAPRFFLFFVFFSLVNARPEFWLLFSPVQLP